MPKADSLKKWTVEHLTASTHVVAQPVFHRDFEKDFERLDRRLKAKCMEAIKRWMADPDHPQLNNHVIHFAGCRSINVTGDFRALYRPGPNGIGEFTKVRNHSQLYG